jgi:peptidoglycan/xylan/chitin deacetylase (PgdA/CDA1 family)
MSRTLKARLGEEKLARQRRLPRWTVLVLVLPVALIPGATWESDAEPLASPARAASQASPAVPERTASLRLPTRLASPHRSDDRKRSHRRAVPILMYHVIGKAKASAPYPQLYISAKVLAGQMRYLDRHGYEVVRLQELYDYWHGAPLPAKAVVLSFDDGFRSDYTRVRPLLAAHGWAGTLNLVLSHYQRSWGLGRHAVEGLIRAGWELDCHTRTHAYLPGLDARSLRSEVAGARRFLRRTFGVPVNFFAYPSGAYDERVIAAVRRAGFEGATTTAFGLARPGDPFTLNRIEVLRSDRIADFAAKLEG